MADVEEIHNEEKVAVAQPSDSSETSLDSKIDDTPTKEFVPINGVSSRTGRPVTSATINTSHSRRSMSRTRSHNGYGCDDNDAMEEDLAADIETGEQRKDPFEVRWEDGDNDPLNPRSMAHGKKWLIVLIVSLSSLCVTCASSIYTSTYAQIEKQFHASRELVTVGLSLFILGLGIGPMLLGPLSEFFGRRPIYLVSFSFFLIWTIPSAVAKNIQTMLIGRFFAGLSGSAFLSVAGGTVGDMFNREQLQFPMLIYTGSPFLGPSIGPLIGGFINQYTHWRWTFYVLLMWSAVNLSLIFSLVPETYHPILLRNKARQMRKDTGDERWRSALEKTDKSIAQTLRNSLQRPFQLLFLEPMVLNLCLFSAILLGILYLFFGAIVIVFEGQHDFTLSQTGLAFLGIFVGMGLGIITDPIWQKNYTRLIKNRELATGEIGGSEPEYRLPPAIAGAVLVPIGLFIFAWTTYRSVHWIAPIIGLAVFGMGNILVFSGVFTFLVDAYPLYAASSLAANSFARSTFGAIFPLFGVQMYRKLGDQWATSLLAFLTVGMMPFPYLFFRYGKKIRGKSRFASA